MPAPEPIQGVRVVAEPGALDRAVWNPDDLTLVWRFAPDEAFAWRPGSPVESVKVDDPDAIIELERGFSGAYLTFDEVADLERHCDVMWPDERPFVVQGKVAGVPVKVWLGAYANGVLLLVQACYVDELRSRLRW